VIERNVASSRLKTASASRQKGNAGRIVSYFEVGEKRAYGKLAGSVPTSLRAVSEAPKREKGRAVVVWGRFRYSDLKEAAGTADAMGFE